MERQEVTKTQIVNQLLRVGHGKFDIYEDVGLKAVAHEPEFFGHFIAFNHKKGEVRDTKVALPVIALRGKTDLELYENAVSHLLLLDTRNLVRAVEFNKKIAVKVGTGGGRMLKDGCARYLREREANRGWWNNVAVQHRESLKSLYAYSHIKPATFAQEILFQRKYRKGTVFHALANLKDMKPKEAAGTILNFKIPFTIATGAYPRIKEDTDVILALITQMSGNELITNSKMLSDLGAFTNPVLKSAYDDAVIRMSKDKRVSSMKAGAAAGKLEKIAKDGGKVLPKKATKALKSIQEDRMAHLGGIDGNWLVLGDKSSSMSRSIEVARQVAGLVANQVKGEVHLVFFNSGPTHFDVSGKSYDEIVQITKRQMASGMTSIGCGLDYILQKGVVVNGIAVCSDGGENTPHSRYFSEVYKKYASKIGIDPPVYFFHVPGDTDRLTPACKSAGVLIEKFDLGHDVDYYSLPNIVNTLKTSRYKLVDEIMETPLMTFDMVFAK